MKRKSALVVGFLAAATALQAATITVNTANNLDFSAGKTNLYLALSLANTNGAAANTINFNIPGLGAHYIATPTNGYPLITNNNITIDGYSQPGSAPNTNPILAANNAQIKIVLDSRIDPASPDPLGTSMDYAPGAGNTGFGAGEVAILGLFRATNFWAKGLCFLGQFSANYDMFGVGIAGDFVGTSHHCHVSGCWFGVDLDGTTVSSGFVEQIAAHRHRDNPATAQIGSDFVTVGVAVGSANPRAEFNVFLGAIETINIEANNGRISGNFIGVYPSGNKCWIGQIDGAPLNIGDNWRETHIEIGRFNKNTVIGVDGDGVNDADERNIFGGVLDTTFWPLSAEYTSLRGYTHTIEFYGNNTTIGTNSYGPSTNNIIAGNYFGVGVDGVTRFTNGVPALDGGNPQTRFGSDGDGVSDALEGNVVFNNYPTNIFDPNLFAGTVNPTSKSFYDGLGTGSIRNAQRNRLVNNFPFPMHPGSSAGTFLTNYYNQTRLVPTAVTSDVYPTIDPTSTILRLKGTIPIANATYPTTIIDLYVPDPEGIANGLLAADPAQPDGWIQGRTHLGSFVAGSASDLDPSPGGFEFDISSIPNVSAGPVTITATYSKSPAGTHNAIGITSPFATPVSLVFIPGGAESVGLTHIVPDKIVWFNGADNTPRIGNFVVGQDVANGGSVEATAGVLGDSTFLLAASMKADDGVSMRFTSIYQPAAGGTPKLGDLFYADNGTPYTNKINQSRQDGNPGRVAGDPRYGAVNFIGAGEVSLWAYPAFFNSDGRFDAALPLYAYMAIGNARDVCIQSYALNPITLSQTMLTKAKDSAYGGLTGSTPPAGASGDQLSRTGGTVAGLDNGNFVSVVEDRSRFFNAGGNASVATIFAPNGSIVKAAFKVADADQWANVGAFKGGFYVRPSGGSIYFYDNAGNLQGSLNHNTTSGLTFDTGRGDGTRTCSDIRSHYVFMAGRAPDNAAGPVWLAVFDANTRAFVTKAQVSDTDTALHALDRVNVACDALNRVCVTFRLRPVALDFSNQQIAARVLRFDGANLSYLTHSFFPFINHDSVGGVNNFTTQESSVAMTPRQIFIYAEGTVNSTNNPSGLADTTPQTHVYTVLSHPAPVAAPRPVITATRTGGNVTFSWNADDGLFTLQSSPTASPAVWTDVNPQPPTVLVGSQNTKTVALGAGNLIFRLVR